MADAGPMTGTCHCGLVRVTVPRKPEQVTQCNCTLCTKTGFRGVYFASDDLVIEGEVDSYVRTDLKQAYLATHRCTACGHEDRIFGTGGGERIAADFGVPLLGSLPLEARIREQTDAGTPTVAATPDAPAAGAFRAAARRMAAELAVQGRDYSARFPRIVVEDS